MRRVHFVSCINQGNLVERYYQLLGLSIVNNMLAYTYSWLCTNTPCCDASIMAQQYPSDRLVREDVLRLLRPKKTMSGCHWVHSEKLGTDEWRLIKIHTKHLYTPQYILHILYRLHLCCFNITQQHLRSHLIGTSFGVCCSRDWCYVSVETRTVVRVRCG